MEGDGWVGGGGGGVVVVAVVVVFFPLGLLVIRNYTTPKCTCYVRTSLPRILAETIFVLRGGRCPSAENFGGVYTGG